MDFSSARLVPVAGTDGWLARVPGAIIWAPGDGEAVRELVAACLIAGSATELLRRTGAHLADPDAEAWPAFAMLVSRADGLIAIVHGPVELTVDQDGDGHTLFGGDESGSWLNRRLSGTWAARAGKPSDDDGIAELREGVVRASGFALVPPGELPEVGLTSKHESHEGEDELETAAANGSSASGTSTPEPSPDVPATSEPHAGSGALGSTTSFGTGVSGFASSSGSDALDVGTTYVATVATVTSEAGTGEADDPTVVDQSPVFDDGPSPLVKLTWDNGQVNELVGAALVGRDVAFDEAVLSGELDVLVPEGQNDSMSRVHAEVRPSGRDIVVVDRGSTNGTFVWDEATKAWQRLSPGEPHTVRLGAVLAFGERTATFEAIAS